MNPLAKHLKSINQTQRDFAAQLGVRDATVSAWVNGKTPSSKAIGRIAQATGGAVGPASWFDASEQQGAA